MLTPQRIRQEVEVTHLNGRVTVVHWCKVAVIVHLLRTCLKIGANSVLNVARALRLRWQGQLGPWSRHSGRLELYGGCVCAEVSEVGEVQVIFQALNRVY